MHLVHASTEIVENLLHKTNCLSRTGVQPRLVVRSFLPASWMIEVRNEHSMNLCYAMNERTITLGQIKLYRRRGDLCAKKIINVVKTLSVNIIIAIYFIDKYLTSMYPTERRLKPPRSRPDAILLAGGSDKLAVPTALAQQEKSLRDCNYNRKSETKNKRQVQNRKTELNKAQ